MRGKKKNDEIGSLTTSHPTDHKKDNDDADGNDGDSLPDDNISQYSSGDDDSVDGE